MRRTLSPHTPRLSPAYSMSHPRKLHGQDYGVGEIGLHPGSIHEHLVPVEDRGSEGGHVADEVHDPEDQVTGDTVGRYHYVRVLDDILYEDLGVICVVSFPVELSDYFQSIRDRLVDDVVPADIVAP